MNIPRLFLVFIVLLGFFIRFYRISEVPVSLYWDEVAHSYNAYSILKTGRDEYSVEFPFILRSFDDFKRAGHTYLTILPVSIWGLNEFSARFVSAFLGSLSLIIVYFLAREIHRSLDREGMYRFSLLATLLFAISPWHIQFSRAGFEANTSLFFILLGTVFFLKGLKNENYLSLSAFFWGISFFIYPASYLFVPLLVLGAVLIYRDQLRDLNKMMLGMSVVVFLLLLGILLPTVVSKDALTRGRQVNIFVNSEEEVYIAAQKIEVSGGGLIPKLIYNRRLVYARIALENFVSHYMPSFLFIRGDRNARHTIFDMGYLYLWEMPFLLIGILFLIFSKAKTAKFLLWWLLIAPLPATFSTPAPHAMRSLYFLPMPQMLTTVGVLLVWKILKSQSVRR